jgi:2-succinyl-5-enolpyruvyl-6-hydroxy-3-cyclohexene-1-carboxylate synthase
MKIKINRNIIWTEIFVKVLLSAGVKYACISPGSRSTPLTYAVAKSSIRSFIHIDERSGGFFATGLARITGSPVILISTSGTAAAEYYPAIIEAYQQRIPLIVCTADRPSGAFLKGINQTINQENLFSNHIQWFADAGLPDPGNLKHIISVAEKALYECFRSGRPVHINFPFEKPFEPESHTDEIEEPRTDFNSFIPPDKDVAIINFEQIAGHIMSMPEGLITIGPSDLSSAFRKSVIRFSEITGYPVFADGASRIRSGSDISPSVFSNYDAIIRSGYFKNNKPSVILHFGRNMTSKSYELFLLNYNGNKFIINKDGDVFDPAGRYDSVIAADEVFFLNSLNSYFDALNFRRRNSAWFSKLSDAESIACRIKKETIYLEEFPDEGRIIPEILKLMPDNSNLMLSNSMPVRDFDYFAQQTPGRINIFHNRGASGIDGIISTALGIAAAGETTLLLTGDLAFYHDMNGLIASGNHKIPLVIILINNNGGGIFRALPISAHSDIFEEYFITPHNLDFRKFVEGYGGVYKLIGNWSDFSSSFLQATGSDKLTVLEIRTDSLKSLQSRSKFWEKVKEKFSDTGII